jgi:hypothetical protein
MKCITIKNAIKDWIIDGANRSHSTTQKYPGIYRKNSYQRHNHGNSEHCLSGTFGHEYPALGICGGEWGKT